jgi:hypothetical protein
LNSLGKYKEAKEGILKALKIKKIIFGENHIDYAICLENLCVILNNIG